MKLKLWHLILQKIVKVSSGQKNQTFCQIYMKKSFLSLPITFSVLVNVIPYQIFIQNTQITVFKKISTKFGALPLLQECPTRVTTLLPEMSVTKDKQNLVQMTHNQNLSYQTKKAAE